MVKKCSSSARVAEINSVCMSIVSEFKADASLADVPILPDIIADLSAKNTALGKSITGEKVVSTTKISDDARDKAYRDIGTMISGLAVVRDEEKKKKALTLKTIYDKYGRKAVALTQQSESAVIRNFLSDMEGADAKAAVEAFDGLAELLAELKAAQDDFDKATSDYREAKLNKGESASGVKAQVMEVLNSQLVPFLESMYNKKPYSSFARKVEEIISKTNAVIETRTKKKRAAAAAESAAKESGE